MLYICIWIDTHGSIARGASSKVIEPATESARGQQRLGRSHGDGGRIPHGSPARDEDPQGGPSFSRESPRRRTPISRRRAVHYRNDKSVDAPNGIA
ncbi:hypothetical protein HPB50_016512 [Hyalomma asiaticum]|uniref:Uncharacterized protein n=1 Tax=Hyalomma asiaticum TaxID=266040 RepID=A0ACB7T2S6_HYAAI|nr:hypothetical protein HPB50_016512 [Hyalomma asiaticum]